MVTAELEKTGYACMRFESAEVRAELRERAIKQAKYSLEDKGYTKNYRDEDRDEDGDFLLVVFGERE